MHFLQRVAVCLCCLFLFLRTTLCGPTQPASSGLLTASSSLIISLPSPVNESAFCVIGSSSKNSQGSVKWDKTTWTISDTLSLALTICNWEPDPKKIQAVLEAAAQAVGKKPATTLLEKKFTQKSNNKYNTLLFEITPGYVDKRLTWGDVGEVLGDNGLTTFFETTQQWHTVYFDVMHVTKGQLGNGAVRRWWQLEPPSSGNGAQVGSNRESTLDS